MESPSARAAPQGKLERAGDIAALVSSLEPSDPTLRRGLHIVIGLIVGLGVGLAAFAAIGDFPDVDWRLRPVALLLSVLLLAAFLISFAEFWRRLLRALGPEIGPTRAQAIWFTSGLGRYVPTSLLLPMLRVAMAGREGAPRRIALASVAYEVPLVLTANLVVGAYFIITLPDLSGEWERFLVLALPVLAVIALQPRIFHPLADRTLVRLGRSPLPLSLPARRVFEFVGLYALALVPAGMGVYFLAQCVHPVGAGDLPTVVGAFAVGTVLSHLAFISPGGLGAREAGIALALYPVMPAAPALAIAVLARIVQLGVEVVLALLMPVLARRYDARRMRNAVPLGP